MSHEDDLLKKIKNGDSGSLNMLISHYYPGILRYCLWHTPNRQTAEDATQDTFVKAMGHLDDYTHRGRFKAYLFTIAAHVCIDYSRKKKTEPLPPDLAREESGFAAVEAEADFALLLANLPPEQREAVLLRYVHNCKLREIAAITATPLRTVQSRLKSARKRIEKDLEKGGNQGA